MTDATYEARLLERAREIDRTANTLRDAALASKPDGYNRGWEALRDAALEFAHVHDAYMLEQAALGAAQLVGSFAIVYDASHRQEYVARTGTNTFIMWCGYHHRELATDPQQEYPIMTWDAAEHGWVIDLSEVDHCPGLGDIFREDDADFIEEFDRCQASWRILEVPSPSLSAYGPEPSSVGVGAIYATPTQP